MHTRLRILINIYFCSLSVILQAQDSILFKESDVVIVEKKPSITTPLILRQVESIKPEQMNNTISNSAQELLQYSASADVQTRGPAGVQSDISIRGGSFEQTLVLFDGIPLRDPQTGHHLLNLPFTSDLINEIEILKGPGSRSFGSNSLSGVVHFISHSKLNNLIKARVSVGQYGFFETSLTSGISNHLHNHIINFSRAKSNGYRHNTDFINTTAAYSSNVNIGANKAFAFIGYNEKEFGANGFYSRRFPNQFEKTKTLLMYLRGELQYESAIFYPKVFYRRHDDDFVLKREDPAFYRNRHRTEVLGVGIHNRIISSFGTSMVSANISQDFINSTNLKNHKRKEYGVSLEHLIALNEHLRFSAGTYLYNYDGYGWGNTPGADLSYIIDKDNQLFLSIATSFRIPTFTELYYSDPNQQGNSKLQPEKGIAYELGWRFRTERIHLSANAFLHNLKDGIDWVKFSSSDSKATAANLTEVAKQGLDFSFHFYPSNLKWLAIENICIAYTYTDSRKFTNVYESKYLLSHLRHYAMINGLHNIFDSFYLSWISRYYDRSTTGSALLVDLAFKYKFFDCDTFIKASNIFNKLYYHFPGVPLSGRWVSVSVEYKI